VELADQDSTFFGSTGFISCIVQMFSCDMWNSLVAFVALKCELKQAHISYVMYSTKKPPCLLVVASLRQPLEWYPEFASLSHYLASASCCEDFGTDSQQILSSDHLLPKRLFISSNCQCQDWLIERAAKFRFIFLADNCRWPILSQKLVGHCFLIIGMCFQGEGV
jgi:hypothetical protein